jgi:hypothetical protein
MVVIKKHSGGHPCNKCNGTGELYYKPKSKKSDELLYALYEKTRLNPRVSFEFTLSEGWRIDFAEITKTDYFVEYEIKTSLADLKADFKKYKHERFAKMEFSNVKHGIWGNFSPLLQIPNRFYYVVTKELEEKAKGIIPDYSGLLVLDGYLRQVKNAPFIHKEKATQDLEKAILLNAAYRARKLFFKTHEAAPRHIIN